MTKILTKQSQSFKAW